MSQRSLLELAALVRSELPLHGLMKVDVNCVLVQLAAVLDLTQGTRQD